MERIPTKQKKNNEPMSNLTLTSKETGDFKPHPEGIYPAVCVDVIDLGLAKTEFQGQEKVVPKVKLVWESEQLTEDGRRCTISKNFTASLHPKAKLPDFLGKWRGRPVAIGETIDLPKLIGACCTLVISHQQNMVGRTYASIDAVSKPTKKLMPSGTYDAAAVRQRIAEWQAKQGGQGTGVRSQVTAPQASFPGQRPATASTSPQPNDSVAPASSALGGPSPAANSFRQFPTGSSPQGGGGNKNGAATAPRASEDDIPFDPEIGF